MGTRVRHQRWGSRIAVALSVLAGVLFVAAGIAGRDVLSVVAGVLIPVVVLVLVGPLTRWLRRGDGPYATRSDGDDARETYVRLRHTGGNSYGR